MPGDDLPIDISLVHSRRAERLVHHHAPCLFSTFNTNRPHQKKKKTVKHFQTYTRQERHSKPAR